MTKQKTTTRGTHTTDAVEILHRRFVGDDPKRSAALAQARTSAQVAAEIHDLRTKAGFTQKQLAEIVGTTPSVISRLEDDDYDGHSLSMLHRVATALGRTLQVKFVARKAAAKRATAARST